MSLLHSCLNLFTISRKLVLSSILFCAKLAFSQFEVVNLDTAGLFVLLCVLRELFKLILLVVKRLVQVLDTAAGSFDLLLHTIVFLKRSRKLCHPELTHLIILGIEAGNVIDLRWSKFSNQLVLQLIVLENLHELHNV